MKTKETILGLIGGIKCEVNEELNQTYMKHGRITAQKASDIDHTQRYELQAQCHILESQVEVINKITSVIEEALPESALIA